MKQKNLWITVGIPGAGKSTYLAKDRKAGTVVSRDAIRFSLLQEDEDYFAHEDQVWDLFIKLIRQRFEEGYTMVYADATHLNRASRKKLINALDLDTDIEINCLFFNVPLDVAIERNEQRTGRALVPRSVIRRMYNQLEKPTHDEGFTKIRQINADGSEALYELPSDPRIWLISDLHFNHDREFIWGARGFYDVEEMNEQIISRFNSKVAPNDIVYILGDICLGGGDEARLAENQELIERLNGTIHIIRGNHDTDRRVRMYEACKNVEGPVLWADMINYKGYHFYLSHFPTMTGNLEKESLKQCTCNLFGHTHQTSNFYMDMPFMYHVGVDSQNCYPVLLDDIIEEMNNKVKECLEEI
jgi:calcineurin-like phosphoesterase family protein/predicted kinase